MVAIVRHFNDTEISMKQGFWRVHFGITASHWAGRDHVSNDMKTASAERLRTLALDDIEFEITAFVWTDGQSQWHSGRPLTKTRR